MSLDRNIKNIEEIYSVKEFLCKIWKKKIYLNLIPAFVLVALIVYFGNLFIKQNESLKFTSEDSFILYVFAIVGIILCVAVVWLVYKVNKLSSDLANAEDNIIRFVSMCNNMNIDTTYNITKDGSIKYDFKQDIKVDKQK